MKILKVMQDLKNMENYYHQPLDESLQVWVFVNEDENGLNFDNDYGYCYNVIAIKLI